MMMMKWIFMRLWMRSLCSEYIKLKLNTRHVIIANDLISDEISRVYVYNYVSHFINLYTVNAMDFGWINYRTYADFNANWSQTQCEFLSLCFSINRTEYLPIMNENLIRVFLLFQFQSKFDQSEEIFYMLNADILESNYLTYFRIYE